MGSFIYNLLDQVFGDGSTKYVEQFIEAAFSALNTQFNDSNSIVSNALGIFAAISASLLILFFFMQLVDQAARDMFSMEKLIIAWIKLIMAFTIILNVVPIMNGLVKAGDGFYHMMKGFSLTSTTGTGETFSYQTKNDEVYTFDEAGLTTWNSDEAKANVSEDYKGWKGIKDHIGLIVTSLVCVIIMWIASGVGVFLVISNCIQIIVRGALSPLAIVQLFDEGMRSSGIRYLKKFAGCCFMFAVLITIMHAGNAVSAGFIQNTGITPPITEGNINDALSMSNLLLICVVKIAVIGAMVGAGRISDEVWGS